MERLRSVPFCQALDRGDVLRLAEIAGVASELSRQVRDRAGDCGCCRFSAILLARQSEHDWIDVAPLSDREMAFYTRRVGADTLQKLLDR